MARWSAGLLILLVAAFVRIWHFGEAPPGLQHDEIFYAQDGVQLVTQGDWRIFYPSNQGHEGGYIWLLGLSYALFGTTLVMVRFPALACGLLTAALVYRVASDMYGSRTGIFAGMLAAVSFWAVFTSRVGLRAVSLPVVTLLMIWGLWRLCYSRRLRRRWLTALLTGVALGFAFYTYTSSFALFIAYGAFLAALALFDRPRLKLRWRELAMVTVLGTVLTIPMIYVRLTDPQGQNRVSSISRPWNDFREGRPQELLDNAAKLAGMPLFTGDPEWRYNVAGRPLFATPVGLLTYVGLGLLFWRVRRQPVNALLVTLAVVGLIPSLLTVEAPSFLRSIIALPSVMIFVAAAVESISRVFFKIGASRVAWGVGGLALAVTAATDLPAYFSEWVRHDEVYAIYRDDLQQLAAYLRDRDEPLALVSTLDPELDPLIYLYSNPPADTDTVFFTGQTNLTLSEQPALLFVSLLSPISAAHADWLTPANGTEYVGVLPRQDGQKAFDIYRVSASGDALKSRLEQVSQTPIYLGPPVAFPSGDIADWGLPYTFPVNFGNLIAMIGVELPRRQIYSTDDGVNIQLYFRPLVNHLNVPLTAYVHVLRLDGTVAAQRDLIGVAPAEWNAQTIFIQDNFVVTGTIPTGRYILSAGIYNWVTGERLKVIDNQGQIVGERIIVSEIDVVTR